MPESLNVSDDDKPSACASNNSPARVAISANRYGLMMRRGGMEKSIQSTARISQSGDCLMAKDKPLNWKDIEIERAGKTIRGRYALDGGVVIVRTGFGEKATQLGGSSGESVARMLLGFLGDEGKTSPP